MRTDHPTIPPVLVPPPRVEPTHDGPNRAARRGKHTGTAPASPARGAAPHARGAQGRRVNPVRRTG